MINKKILVISILVLIFSLFSISNVYAAEDILVTKEVSSNKAVNIDEKIELEDGSYKFLYYTSELKEKNVKIESYTSEEQETSTNNEELLKEIFGKDYEFEDELYKGTLEIKNFEIETINHGYYEKLDTKEIKLSNLPSNDLEQIEKEKIIDGRTYYLISVDWKANTETIIDNISVPISYNGTAYYQTIVKIYNPDTYKVKANYEGNVYSKEDIVIYSIYYEKENINIIGPVATIVIVFTIGLLIYFFKPDITIYDMTGKRVKYIKYKENKIYDITNPKVFGSKFIMKVHNSSFNKLKGKNITIKLNYLQRTMPILQEKQYFDI